MFKKSITILLVLSPVWFSLFIGYPVLSDEAYKKKVDDHPGIVVSKRCSSVGDFREYRQCFPVSEKLRGIRLIHEAGDNIGDVFSGAPFIVTTATIIVIIFSWVLIIG